MRMRLTLQRYLVVVVSADRRNDLAQIMSSLTDTTWSSLLFLAAPRVTSSHLLGNSVADEHFRRNAVHFRRIRQLADGVSDDIERDRRRRGKFFVHGVSSSWMG